MAEEEVAKHTKKIFGIWNSKEHSIWHKIQELLTEIFIIVFAVSISIWFHNLSEHSNQQKETKEFLLGLREDLLSDIKEMEADKSSYLEQGKAFKYLYSLKLQEKANTDSLRKYQGPIFNTTALNANNGRFEGFKSSGKIGTIEDQVLQNEIMDLYQEDIPSLLTGTDVYLNKKKNLFDFVDKNLKRTTDSTTNIMELTAQEEIHNLSRALSSPVEILERYQLCIDKMRSISNKIEEIYQLKKKDEHN